MSWLERSISDISVRRRLISARLFLRLIWLVRMECLFWSDAAQVGSFCYFGYDLS